MGTDKNAKNGVARDSMVVLTAQGTELRGTGLRFNRHTAVFELYDPDLTLRLSEALPDFKIFSRDQMIYAGRAVIRALVNTGLTLVCEVTLAENGWADMVGI